MSRRTIGQGGKYPREIASKGLTLFIDCGSFTSTPCDAFAPAMSTGLR